MQFGGMDAHEKQHSRTYQQRSRQYQEEDDGHPAGLNRAEPGERSLCVLVDGACGG